MCEGCVYVRIYYGQVEPSNKKRLCCHNAMVSVSLSVSESPSWYSVTK